MARYDYKCDACDHVFEVEHPMGQRPEIHCPVCDAHASRVFDTSGISFKGSGFYNTDNRTSSKPTVADVGSKPGLHVGTKSKQAQAAAQAADTRERIHKGTPPSTPATLDSSK